MLENTDPNNKNQIINLHIHKLRYFQKSANIVKLYFSNMIGRKIEDAEKLLNQAEDNKESYQKVVKLGQKKLSNAWSNLSTRLNNSRNNTVQNINILRHNNVKPELKEIYSYSSWLSETRGEIEIMADKPTERIIDIMFNDLKYQFTSFKKKILLAENSFEVLEKDNFQFKIDSKKDEYSILFPDILTYEYLRDRLIRNVEPTLKGNKSYLLEKVEALDKKIKNTSFHKKTDEIISDAKKELSKEFDVYFNEIRVYVSAVHSLQAKGLIESVGLSEELDILDKGYFFTTKQKADFKNRALNAIFSNAEKQRIGFLNEIENLIKNVEDIESKTRGIKINVPESNIKRIKVSHNEILRKMEDEVNLSINELMNQVSDEIRKVQVIEEKKYSEVISEYKTKNERLTKKKKLVFTTVIMIAALIFFSYVILSGVTKPDSIFIAVSIPLITTLCIKFVSKRFNRIKDTYNADKEKENEEYLKKCKAVLSGILDTEFEKFDFNKESLYSDLKEEVIEEWSKVRNSIIEGKIIEEYKNFQDKLFDIQSKYNSLIMSYSKAIDSHYTNSNNMLIFNQKHNEINGITEEIKVHSIQPSLGRIRDRRDELNTLLESIMKISFS